MGARLYDPALGRFLQTDPVYGGSANTYDYVSQDPVNGLDLLGTEPHDDPNAPAADDGSEHTKNARPSTEQKHQEGKARKQRDQARARARGGTKGGPGGKKKQQQEKKKKKPQQNDMRVCAFGVCVRIVIVLS